MRRVALAVALILVASGAQAVSIDWVTVGAAGNPVDDTGFGSVADAYRISRHEVTVSQYAEFLNATAESDPHGLFVPGMQEWQGITRTGSDGDYAYTVTPGRESRAMGHVQFANALRFSNWMHNGQGSGDTESGAYTITGSSYSNGSIVRSPNASIFLPTEDQWYKAAYFNSVSSSYFEYPTSSNSPGTCSAPSSAPNRANCGGVLSSGKEMTDVGAYSSSASPYGTFDQGGNAWEWNESWLVGETGGIRGGSGGSNTGPGFEHMAASYRGGGSPPPLPGSLDIAYGFRLAAPIPEPSTALLFGIGLSALAATSRRRPS
jgi:formylglycine-generating enzyme